MDTLLSKEQRIIAAAEQVFAKHGFEKCTVDEIIALADVGKGTLYKYFGNKEQLFYYLVQKKNTLFVERLDAAVKHGLTLEQKLVAFFTEMIDFYKANAALWQIIYFEMLGGNAGLMVHTVNGVPTVISRYEAKPSEETKDMMIRYHLLLESEFIILKGLIESGMEKGELKPGDAELDSMSLFFGVAMSIFHPHKVVEETSCDILAQQIVDRALRGIGK